MGMSTLPVKPGSGNRAMTAGLAGLPTACCRPFWPNEAIAENPMITTFPDERPEAAIERRRQGVVRSILAERTQKSLMITMPPSERWMEVNNYCVWTYKIAIFHRRCRSPEAQRGAGTMAKRTNGSEAADRGAAAGLSGRHHRRSRRHRAQPRARRARLSSRHGDGRGGKRQPPRRSPRIGKLQQRHQPAAVAIEPPGEIELQQDGAHDRG
jgi:hypothetical protein